MEDSEQAEKKRTVELCIQPEDGDDISMQKTSNMIILESSSKANRIRYSAYCFHNEPWRSHHTLVQPSRIDIIFQVGLALIVDFVAASVLLSLRHSGALYLAPLLLSHYNMFLAGTIIFGGGPVVAVIRT